MDYNGNDTTGGSGVPDDIDITSVCAGTGTFGLLQVGACGAPVYKFPTVAKNASYASAVISDSGGPTITVDGTNETISIYWLALGASTFNVPQGEYLVADLVKQIQDQFNAFGAATNVFSMWVDGSDGHVKMRFTTGDQVTLAFTSIGCLVDLGDPLGGGPTTFGANVTLRLANAPATTGSNQKNEWMNYNFNQAGNLFRGDLTIQGELEVHTLVNDIQVEDSLINLNINGSGDTNSSGVVMNSFNNTRWGGIIKANNGSNFHLFANSATLPTAIGWVPESTGNLFLSKLGAGTASGTAQMDVKSNSINTIPLVIDTQAGHAVDVQEWRVDGILKAKINQDGKIVSSGVDTGNLSATSPITFGDLPNRYIMPATAGTNGQAMITDALGNVTWEDIVSHTGGAVSIPEVATFSATDGTTIAGSGCTASAGLMTTEGLRVGSGATTFYIDKTPVAGGLKLSTLTTDRLVIEPAGTITIGDGATTYNLPATRGTDGDVLVSDATGTVTWGNASQIVSPDTDTEINADNGSATIVLDSISRLDIQSTFSDLRSPSGTQYIRVLDDRVETNIRTKTLADAEVTGKAFVGQLIGNAQSNVYSVNNTRVGFCVDMPTATTALNTIFAKNNVLQASIDNDGKAFFPVISTQSIDGASAAPLVIGDTTATAVDISKAGATTTIKGNAKVDIHTDIGGDLVFRSAVFAGGLPALAGIFTATSDQQIVNTTTETTLIPTGVGFLTIPANIAVIGNTISISMSGYLDTAFTPNLTLRFKYGATTLQTQVLGLATIGPTSYWGLDCKFVIRSIGATGTVQFSGNFNYDDTGTQKSIGLVSASTSVIDTTSASAIDVTAQWSAANAGNDIVCQIATVSTLF